MAILRWRQIPMAEWAAATLLLAIPGMLGEALVLYASGHFHAEVERRILLGVADVVTLQSR